MFDSKRKLKEKLEKRDVEIAELKRNQERVYADYKFIVSQVFVGIEPAGWEDRIYKINEILKVYGDYKKELASAKERLQADMEVKAAKREAELEKEYAHGEHVLCEKYLKKYEEFAKQNNEVLKELAKSKTQYINHERN